MGAAAIPPSLHVIPSVAEESRRFGADSLQGSRFLGYARNDMDNGVALGMTGGRCYARLGYARNDMDNSVALGMTGVAGLFSNGFVLGVMGGVTNPCEEPMHTPAVIFSLPPAFPGPTDSGPHSRGHPPTPVHPLTPGHSPRFVPFSSLPVIPPSLHVIPSVAEESRRSGVDSSQGPRFLGYARNDMDDSVALGMTWTTVLPSE